jgi:hypothetical protein
MEAPKGRYSVVEKDGRLVVIDNSTGGPAMPAMPSPRPGRPAGSSMQAPSPGRLAVSAPPIVAAKGMLDSAADFLLTLAVKEWDADGYAVVGWEWKENGKKKRWDARLDPAAQRRLGRALLRLASAPLFILWLVVLSGPIMWIALALTAVPVATAVHRIAKLQRETGGIVDCSAES